jgi:hypothetical protein
MTFWDFLDRQIRRLKPSGVAGAGIFVLTFAVLWMLRDDRTLADNDLFKTLAQAIVVQGLIGLAMASWFTTNRDGRTETRIINEPSDPIPVEPATEDEDGISDRPRR